MSVSCKAVLAAINMALGTQYAALSEALDWYASPLAQAEDFTAEFSFKPGSKRPNMPLKHILKEGQYTMENQVLEAVKEMEGTAYSSLAKAREAYGGRELLDIWLRYEGISGYTDTILNAISAIFNTYLEDL